MEIKPKWIFCLLLCTNIIINLDQGIIPAATQQIEESLELTSEQLGYLGSQVYAGVTIVCLFGGKLFLHFNSKMIVMFSYIGMISSLTLFPLNYGSSWPFYIFRFLTGCSKVVIAYFENKNLLQLINLLKKAPMMIYFPVWVDNFGGESKTIWITILQGVIPLGIFVGYSLSSVISSLWQWQAAFYLQVIMLTVCATIFIIFVRNNDFDIKKNTKSKLGSKSVNNEEQQNGSLLAQTSKKSYCQMMKELYSIKLWLCCTIVISILYFIVTGIQFWMTDYMIKEMHQEKQTVNIVFAIVSITAPVFGCITGGLIAQKLGGYQRTKSLYICVLYCSLCCISAAPVPFTETFWFGALCLWFLLFFGGAIVPPLMGIMLSSVPKHLKAFANSSTTMFQNLFGFLPAPSIYGFLMERYNSQVAVFALMYYSFVGLFVMLLAVYFKRMQNNKKVGFEEVFARQDDSKQSVLHDEENFNLTVRVLQYGDAPLVTSLTPHIDDQILNYDNQEEVNQKEI